MWHRPQRGARKIGEFSSAQVSEMLNNTIFTQREREVIRLRWREGLTRLEISERLEPVVSERTVGTIIKEIREKVKENRLL